MKPSVPRRRDYQKDAVIAAAILVVLLLMWRVLKRPEQFGAAGERLKTAVFGASGTALVERLGSGGESPVAAQPGTNRVAAADHPNGSPATNSAFEVVAQPRPTDESPAEEPVKIIAALPAELAEAPATTSVDAAAISQRLNAAGAKSGDIQLSLIWNDFNDLDLHCFDPHNERIWYQHKRSAATGGELDVDRNAQELVSAPVENIFWPSGSAPPGLYRLYVIYYAQHGTRGAQATPYTVRVIVENQTNYFTGKISFTGKKELHWICTFQYDPTNPDPMKHRRFLSSR